MISLISKKGKIFASQANVWVSFARFGAAYTLDASATFGVFLDSFVGKKPAESLNFIVVFPAK